MAWFPGTVVDAPTGFRLPPVARAALPGFLGCSSACPGFEQPRLPSCGRREEQTRPRGGQPGTAVTELSSFYQCCSSRGYGCPQDPSAMPRPTSQDLAGYWDMLQLSVEDVSMKFDELQRLRLNDWKMMESPERKRAPSNTLPHHSNHLLQRERKSSQHTLGKQGDAFGSPEREPGLVGFSQRVPLAVSGVPG
ncbi:hypothetical protein P7K49_027775 [Saguinus oedipus]|uniref:Uncharacterized protein n=1 Tax=Saguinus oedipus TaxID=9490 RepID=A0ABQ9UAD9_SAGOE|nr:hypothetical protein P7K49_027775 [Saguinus oedipus]